MHFSWGLLYQNQTTFMPYKWLYITAIICFTISTLIFAIFRARLYYTNYNFIISNDVAHTKYQNLLNRIDRVIDSIKKHPDKITSEEIASIEKELKDLELEKTWSFLIKESYEVGGKLIEANEFIILNKHVDWALKICTIIYIIGLGIGSAYIVLFINFYT